MRYLLSRLIVTVPTLLGILTVVFLVLRVLPGDPAELMLGTAATQEQVANLRTQLGLDRPLLVQYFDFLSKVVRGDFGDSYRTRRPVMGEVFNAFPHTFFLALASVILSCVLGVWSGTLSALRRNSMVDYVVTATAMLGISMPIFTIGIVLIWVFSNWLGWFPILGAGDLGKPLEYAWHLVLPTLALGASGWASVGRVARSSILDILNEDYVRTARAKGLSERAINYGHVLRNALVPIITIVGLRMGVLLGGTVITETLFVRPGIGRLLVQAIFERDYPQIEATVAFFAVIFVAVNLLVDMSYATVDPRIRRA